MDLSEKPPRARYSRSSAAMPPITHAAYQTSDEHHKFPVLDLKLLKLTLRARSRLSRRHGFHKHTPRRSSKAANTSAERSHTERRREYRGVELLDGFAFRILVWKKKGFNQFPLATHNHSGKSFNRLNHPPSGTSGLLSSHVANKTSCSAEIFRSCMRFNRCWKRAGGTLVHRTLGTG